MWEGHYKYSAAMTSRHALQGHQHAPSSVSCPRDTYERSFDPSCSPHDVPSRHARTFVQRVLSSPRRACATRTNVRSTRLAPPTTCPRDRHERSFNRLRPWRTFVGVSRRARTFVQSPKDIFARHVRTFVQSTPPVERVCWCVTSERPACGMAQIALWPARVEKTRWAAAGRPDSGTPRCPDFGMTRGLSLKSGTRARWRDACSVGSR